MKINLNTILAILAGLGVFAPDVAAVATWLASMHVEWLGSVVKGLGLLAALFAAAPRIVPKLRSVLALAGLATPPGEAAPGTPKALPSTTDEAVTKPEIPSAKVAVIVQPDTTPKK